MCTSHKTRLPKPATGPLSVGRQSFDSLLSLAGARVARPFRIGEVLAFPDVYALWGHELLGLDRNVAAAGSNVVAPGISAGRDYGLFGSSITLNVGPRLNLFAEYDLTVGNRMTSHRGTGGAVITW